MGTPQPVPTLAATYLKAIDAPATDSNLKAVSAWMSIESGWSSYKNGTINVVGNNPLNITGTGNCGSRSYAGHKFAVFCTPEEGAQRWASMLKSNWGQHYGYNDIYNALRTGDGNKALTAIIGSGWVTGRRGNQYGHEGSNTLIKVYNSIATKDFTGATAFSSLENWQKALESIGISSDPNHKITQDESDRIAKELYKVDPKLFGSNLVGKTVAEIAKGTNINFDPTAIPGNIADGAATVGDVLTNLSKPSTWIRVAAGIGGAVLVIFGLQIIAKSAISSADFGGVQEVDVIDEPTRQLGITNKGNAE